jgi:tetratricopeptide (TPR) repeat protein
MSSYASGAKLSDLRLDGDPVPGADAPAAGHGAPPPVGTAGRDPIRPNHSDNVNAALALAKERAESIEIPSVEATARATLSHAIEASESKGSDEFLNAANREFAAGDLDQPLWAKAVELAGNDAEVAKPAYLRARAAALRVAKRKKRAEAEAKRAHELAREEKDWPVAKTSSRLPSRLLMVIGGLIGVLVLVIGAVLLLRPGEPPSPVAVSKQAPSIKPVQATKAPAVPERSNLREDFATKVAELKAAGNWNVLVLYAGEWTRKVPDSADAWNELSTGYMKLRQWSDALDAETRVVMLTPKSFQAWQNLGEINVALKRPAAALIAYEQAAALNGRDVTSLVQIGTLNAQLGHLTEAKAAFSQALDVSPLDGDALCGASSIAQKEGHAKDVDAFARQLKMADLRCPEAVTVAPVSVAPPAVATKKPGAPAKR